MRFEDLTPAMQAQVRDKLGIQEQRKRDRRNAELVTTDGCCHACGEHFDNVTKWERHSDETGHRRFDLIGGAASGATGVTDSDGSARQE